MSHLELTRPRPDVAVITLNRPDKLNALNFQLVEELHQTLEDIGSDDGCRVVALTGAGRGFCSGLDLTDPFPDEATRALEFPRSSMR
jgi:enoyl-CoA hydratase